MVKCIARVLLTSMFAGSIFGAYAQKSKFAGINAGLESASSFFRPGYGVHYEQQLSGRSGFEIGVLHRSYSRNLYVTMSNQSGFHSSNIILTESHISIPAVYKRYTRIVDISAGPSFEFYIGWRQRGDNPSMRVSHYSLTDAFNIGLLAKVSKTLKLSDRFYLEPDVRFNPILTNDRNYIAFGLAGKFKLENSR